MKYPATPLLVFLVILSLGTFQVGFRGSRRLPVRMRGFHLLRL